MDEKERDMEKHVSRTIWVTHKNGISLEAGRKMNEMGFCHGVTGRGGGVSKAPYDSLNVALHVGDDPKAVLENRRRLCQVIGCSLPDITMAKQTHEDHIVAVGAAERGCGAGSYATALDHTDVLMTDEKYTPLLICVADCVPIILYDFHRPACAVIHAGWRGTAARIAVKTIFAMTVAYGSRPEELFAFIGPSISAAHFEVSRSTADIFKKSGAMYASCVYDGEGARTVDLWKVNQLQLKEAGLREEHIAMTRFCVFSHADKFFSYRRDGGITGRMAAFAMLS
uniref:peptidoglycan editing factor PgeF n=1 Tax=uncultured Megasphaera sp. TaxID=165188 RepID=UPI0025891EBE|nr:peptidoglycan editing factor PgeF [uncultured Megasphaera sp.]